MKFKVRIEVIETKELIIEAEGYNSAIDKLDTMTDAELDTQSDLVMTSVDIGRVEEV